MGIRLAHVTGNLLIKMFMPTFHSYLNPQTLLLNSEKREMSVSNRARLFVLDLEGSTLSEVKILHILPDEIRGAPVQVRNLSANFPVFWKALRYLLHITDFKQEVVWKLSWQIGSVYFMCRMIARMLKTALVQQEYLLFKTNYLIVANQGLIL